MLVHSGDTPSFKLLPIYTPGWREALCVLSKNTTQCSWPGLISGPFDLELSILTMRTLQLDQSLPLEARYALRSGFKLVVHDRN